MATMWPDVPDAGDSAVPDPNIAGLLAGRTLPAYYLPAAMPTQFGGWRRMAAWTVIVMLIASASAGICLTYGPEELWRHLGIG